jgi:hypothetical protein
MIPFLPASSPYRGAFSSALRHWLVTTEHMHLVFQSRHVKRNPESLLNLGTYESFMLIAE